MTLLIVDLDLPDAETAVAVAGRVAEHVDAFSVGPDLLFGPGPLLISALSALGRPVVADAKLHDTPERVAAAARHLSRYGARWVTAHVAGGQTMLEAAVSGMARGSGGAPTGVLGVTVMPSLDRAALARVGIDRSPGKIIAQMSKAAAAAGCEGAICPPSEIPVVASTAPSLLKVARTGNAATADECRRSVGRGADAVILGAVVTAAGDPAGAAYAISRAMRETPRDG